MRKQNQGRILGRTAEMQRKTGQIPEKSRVQLEARCGCGFLGFDKCASGNVSELEPVGGLCGNSLLALELLCQSKITPT